MKKTPLYAALDLHCERSVLGNMDHQGRTQPPVRFLTQAEALRAELLALRRQRRPLHLTLEAGPLTRWACAVARPLVSTPRETHHHQPQQVKKPAAGFGENYILLP